MSQSQNVIYYTTAQVTDMVELSDQNVRKYVRLLEDRNYEVAKDEHNRRLFSKKDVNVLQEMIRIAKSPGNTLDSAADEIIENMDNFEENEAENQVSKMSDNDVSRLLALVLEKLEDIQLENKELKTNISTLVHRLEEYDLKALEYNSVNEEESSIEDETFEDAAVADEAFDDELTETEAAVEEVVQEETVEDPVEETIEEEIVAEEPVTAPEQVIEEELEAEAVEETVESTIAPEEAAPEAVEKELASEQQAGTIDLNTHDDKPEVPEEEFNNDAEAKQQIEEPKKGFFGKLASMFKG